MVDLQVNPVLVTAIITVLIEVVLMPLFDMSTEVWAGTRNRAVLLNKGSAVPRNDPTPIADVRGVFLSRTHLFTLSFFKKAFFMCLLVSEFFIEPITQIQIKPQKGPAVLALNDFRGPPRASEVLVREIPFLRNVCNENGTRYETVFVGDRPLCGLNKLFAAISEIGEAEAYDAEAECAIGDVFNSTTTTCEGNRISVCAESGSVVGGCYPKMMQLISDRSIRVATTDSEAAVYSDVMLLTFEKPITPKLIELLAQHFHAGDAIMALTFMTGTVIEFDNGAYTDTDIPEREIMARAGQIIVARISTVTIALLGSAVAILLICLTGTAIDVILRRKVIGSRSVVPVNNLRTILSVAAGAGSPLGGEVVKDVEVRIVSKGSVRYQIFEASSDQGDEVGEKIV